MRAGSRRRPHEGDFRVLAHLIRDAHEVLVDIGANHGQSIESMRLFQPDATIVAVEANPVLAQVLTARYADTPKVRIESCGLGEADGAFTPHVPSYRGFVYDGLSSLDRAEATGWLGPDTLYGFDPARLTVAELACRVAPLDSFDLAPAFLKIDVQGLEHAVLVGARATWSVTAPPYWSRISTPTRASAPSWRTSVMACSTSTRARSRQGKVPVRTRCCCPETAEIRWVAVFLPRGERERYGAGGFFVDSLSTDGCTEGSGASG